jgi:hypothetical protein
VRKRLMLLGALATMVLTLALPATASAATPGSFGFVNGYCTGTNTVHATFKLVKYAGVYATDLTMKAQGQGYYGGAWHNEGASKTFTHGGGGSSKVTWSDTFKWNPGHSGKHRIKVVAKIWNGGSVVGSGNDVSGFCQ